MDTSYPLNVDDGRQPIANARTLKIEEDGDYWKKTVKPKIRLKGAWLERAGFTPGQHVSVNCVAVGIIELRSMQPAPSSDKAPSLPGGDP